MKHRAMTDYELIIRREQTEVIQKVANELGLIIYKPNYYGDKTDHNTILVYTQEAYEYNRMIDIEHKDWPTGWKNEQYKRYLVSFVNDDLNGNFDMNYLNHKRINNLKINELEKEVKKTMLEALEEIGLFQCQWCKQLFKSSELHKEKDMGLLCDSCIRAIVLKEGQCLSFEERR